MMLQRRLLMVVVVLITIIVVGTSGYRIMGLKWVDALFMTVITLTTVGYGEIGAEYVTYSAGVRIFTLLLLLSGMGVLLYGISTATAFIVEGELSDILKRRKMDKVIAEMKDHVIVCGIGRIGRYIIEELIKTLRPFLVIDSNKEALDHVQELVGEFPYVIGDATEDATLMNAGIERASGVVTTFGDDKTNLFVTLSARNLNPRARIVSRAVDPHSVEKLKHSGADTAVSTNLIAGMRMVSELVRPAVTSFLDIMLREKSKTLRVEEAHIGEGSELGGSKIEEANIQERTGLAVVAVKHGRDGEFTYSPKGDFRMEIGDTLIVLGDVSNLPALRKIANSPP